MFVHPDSFVDHKQIWNGFSDMEHELWWQFNEFYTTFDGVPVHIIRYEDMLTDPKYAFTELMKFVLNERDLSGRVIEKIIDIATEGKAPQFYQPKGVKTIEKLQLFPPE